MSIKKPLLTRVMYVNVWWHDTNLSNDIKQICLIRIKNLNVLVTPYEDETSLKQRELFIREMRLIKHEYAEQNYLQLKIWIYLKPVFKFFKKTLVRIFIRGWKIKTDSNISSN